MYKLNMIVFYDLATYDFTSENGSELKEEWLNYWIFDDYDNYGVGYCIYSNAVIEEGDEDDLF